MQLTILNAARRARCVSRAVMTASLLFLPVLSYANLSMKQEGDIFVVESLAPPTWKIRIDASKGWVVRDVFIPASSDASIVESNVRHCCAGFGLDNLEWRYIKPGTSTSGVRKPITSTGKGNYTIVENSASRIIIDIKGTNWSCTSGHTKTITILPDRFVADISVDYTCTPGTKSMWWLVTLFPSDIVDCSQAKIRDKDSGPTGLKFCEGWCGLPSGISIPYQVRFPLKSAPVDAVVLEVADFADNANKYELWNDKTHQPSGDRRYYTFYPRWVGKFSQPKTYTFKYGWRFDGAGIDNFNSITETGSVQSILDGNTGLLRSASEREYAFSISAGQIHFIPRTTAATSVSLLSLSGRRIAGARTADRNEISLPAPPPGAYVLAVDSGKSGKNAVHTINIHGK